MVPDSKVLGDFYLNILQNYYYFLILYPFDLKKFPHAPYLIKFMIYFFSPLKQIVFHGPVAVLFSAICVQNKDKHSAIQYMLGRTDLPGNPTWLLIIDSGSWRKGPSKSG